MKNKLELILRQCKELHNSSLGYFNAEIVSGREAVLAAGIPVELVASLMDLLANPLLGIIEKKADNHYQLKHTAPRAVQVLEKLSSLFTDAPATIEDNSKLKTKYFKWETDGKQITAWARREKPYNHSFPVTHLLKIMDAASQLLSTEEKLSKKLLEERLEGKELEEGKVFTSDKQDYKVRIGLGILEMEGFIYWEADKPAGYRLNPEKNIAQLDAWTKQTFGEKIH